VHVCTGTELIDNQVIVDATRRWLERAVIGLGLCPFAESVYRRDSVRFQVSEQRTAVGLVDELRAELMHLHASDARQCETTLLIHPWVLNDFIEFNDFLQICDELVGELGLEGEIQVASFHPQYQFAGTRPDDIENHTNRSPYPTLHLLREASVERALEGVPDPDAIYENNIVRMRELGLEGWKALWEDGERPTGESHDEV
jgi:hypothetical protein